MKIPGVVLMASALAMTGSAAATNAAPARTEALAREADAFFKDQQPGGVVLVTQGDQVLLRRAYGMADIENGVAMRPDAALRLAMSKTVLSDGKASPYGFGWIIGQVQGVADVEHGGFINGFNSYEPSRGTDPPAGTAADTPPRPHRPRRAHWPPAAGPASAALRSHRPAPSDTANAAPSWPAAHLR